MTRRPSYFRTPQLGGASPRETEILAFGLCNDRLGRAVTPRERIDALHKTHQLWSLLVKDLEAEENRLPAELKQQLIRLGFWAMAYSTKAIAEDMSLEPLITLNRDMIDGLRAQEAAAAAARAPAEPAPTARTLVT